MTRHPPVSGSSAAEAMVKPMTANTSPSSSAKTAKTGMSVMGYLFSQFQRPRGPVGHIAGRIMSTRGSNVDRNLWLVDLLELENHHRVLEIGPGPGIALAAVGERVSEGQIVGLDHSATMLAQSKARNRTLVASGQLSLREGSAEDLPSNLGQFDRIYCMNVWQFWTEPASVISSLAELLADDGRLAIGYQPRHSGATGPDAAEDQLWTELTAAGLGRIAANRMDIDPPVVAVIAGRA